MKKVLFCAAGLLIAAVLAAVVVLFGPNSPIAPPAGTDAPGTSGPTATRPGQEPGAPSGPVHIDVPTVSISLPILTETDIADDGTVIFRRTFQDVVLNLGDPALTEAVTLDILRRMDVSSSSVEAVQNSAYADYSGQEQWMPYSYRLLFSPGRADQTVLSLFGTERLFDGVQSQETGLSVTYNLRSGAPLTLGEVLSEESSAADALLAALLSALSEMESEYMLFEDYATVVSGRFQSDLQQESGWFFSGEGLCFFYAPYDIAPNSQGVVVATVPYSALNGILRDIYFPGEQANFPGQLTGSRFDGTVADGFSSFAELVTDPEALSYLLYTDGVLYDVTVEQGQWFGGVRYAPDAVVFYANLLSPDTALMLQAQLPETESPLRLTCRSGDTVYSFYLTADASGEILTLVPVE